MGCSTSQPATHSDEEPVTRKAPSPRLRQGGAQELAKTPTVSGKSTTSGNLIKSGPHSGPDEVPPTNSSSVLPFPVYPSFNREYLLQQFSTEPPREFTYSELLVATHNFQSTVLGEGGFGKVYEGWIEEKECSDSGRAMARQVAVKQLNQQGLQGFNEWLTEVIFLRRLHHPHLVHLVGYCTEGGEGLLVYEYMPNKSLDFHLFSDRGHILSWEQRVKIALGAAKGLAYLHEAPDRQVIFRDLKAGNILLDHDFTAKLSDFGLAKDGPAGDKTHVSTKVVGTYGYTAPEYMQTGHLTAKSDVYAFGVVLLELLSGRRAVDMGRPWEERSLVFWAKPYLSDRRKLARLIDPRLGGRYSVKGVQKFAFSAQCCLLDAKSRPTMNDMVQTLQALQELTEMDGEQHYRSGGGEQRPEGAHSPYRDIGREAFAGPLPLQPPPGSEGSLSPYSELATPQHKSDGEPSPTKKKSEPLQRRSALF